MSEPDALRDWLGEMFDQIAARFDSVDQRLDTLTDSLAARTADLGQRVDLVESVSHVALDAVTELRGEQQ